MNNTDDKLKITIRLDWPEGAYTEVCEIAEVVGPYDEQEPNELLDRAVGRLRSLARAS